MTPEREAVEAASRRCGEDAIQLFEIQLSVALLDAIRRPDIIEVLVRSEATGLAFSLLAQARQNLPL